MSPIRFAQGKPPIDSRFRGNDNLRMRDSSSAYGGLRVTEKEKRG